MKRSIKILNWVVLGMLTLCAILHLITGDFNAFCGWFTAVCWLVVAMIAEANEEHAAKFADSLFEKYINMCDRINKLFDENIQLRSRIHELESKGNDDDSV